MEAPYIYYKLLSGSRLHRTDTAENAVIMLTSDAPI